MNQRHIEPNNGAIFESTNALKALYKQTEANKAGDTKLSYEAVMTLLDVIDLDISMLCYLLGISGYDFKEIKERKQFTNEQCTKILSIANLYGHGYTLFGSRRAFNHWMKYGALNRGSVPPLSLLHQPSGLKEVNDALLRMEYGTF